MLRELPIPHISLERQKQFADVVHGFKPLRAQQREAERQAEHLFQAPIQYAFAGELVKSNAAGASSGLDPAHVYRCEALEELLLLTFLQKPESLRKAIRIDNLYIITARDRRERIPICRI